jgi:hypothetical protein
MANLTKDLATAGLDTSQAITAPHIAGDLLAGANIDPVSPCYIKGADGKAYMSNGTAANEAAKFDGFTAKAYKTGQAVTLFGVGARFRYSAGTLVAGTDLFIGTADGVLADAATTGGLRAIARAINSTDIRVTKNTDAA